MQEQKGISDQAIKRHRKFLESIANYYDKSQDEEWLSFVHKPSNLLKEFTNGDVRHRETIITAINSCNDDLKKLSATKSLHVSQLYNWINKVALDHFPNSYNVSEVNKKKIME
uniref:Uncharacterized protein n=1 Tax=Iridovirus LCIVAC01 TaxID=2506607 RepID=A0A481YPG6_9VIRU|nr:MAG: hypothetical protein LCIVAC01_00120 [Iridovirus LCIVAC01]